MALTISSKESEQTKKCMYLKDKQYKLSNCNTEDTIKQLEKRELPSGETTMRKES